jgi:predicted metal-dependent HD superfamily phosphohydrolase
MTDPDDILAWLAALPFEWTAGCPEPIFLEAREAHRSPGRHYHTWDHVLDCVGKLRTMPCKAPRVALLALVFHDAVYVAGRKDNEAQSANLARDIIAEHASIDEAELAEIEGIILATQSHRPPAEASATLRTVLDIDMSILGAAPDRYDLYAEQVRREYVPTAATPVQFAIGRAAFLSRLLAEGPIYNTFEGRAQWEKPARANIAREITRLNASGGLWARLAGWLRPPRS